MTPETWRLLADVGGTLVSFLIVLRVIRRLLLKELRKSQAALYRILLTERVQSKGLVALWDCMNRPRSKGRCNGETEEAIAAVKKEHEEVAKWLRAALMGQEMQTKLDDDDG